MESREENMKEYKRACAKIILYKEQLERTATYALEGYSNKLINEYDISGTRSRLLDLVIWGILFYFFSLC